MSNATTTKPEMVHVTYIRNGKEVHGHHVAQCDDRGCLVSTRYYPDLDAATVQVGGIYPSNDIGWVVA